MMGTLVINRLHARIFDFNQQIVTVHWTGVSLHSLRMIGKRFLSFLFVASLSFCSTQQPTFAALNRFQFRISHPNRYSWFQASFKWTILDVNSFSTITLTFDINLCVEDESNHCIQIRNPYKFRERKTDTEIKFRQLCKQLNSVQSHCINRSHRV